MKKILLSLLILATSLNAMATDFAVATLTLKGNTSLEQGEVTLAKTDDPAASSYCAPLYIDQYHVVMYALNNSEKYQIWANANLTNLPLGFKTYSDENYTITVSNVSGSQTLKLYDLSTNEEYSLVNNAVVEFSATANSTIEDRFVINYDPSAFKYDITLNGQYLATFSAPENVIIPDGLSAYTAKFQGEQDWLLVHKIDGNYIPANTGVILFNKQVGAYAGQHEFSLVKYAGDVDPIDGINDLKPATAWATVSQQEGTNYVLHDSEMWLYDGANMKKNKAFLHVGIGSGAPQRIRMVFSEEQGIESIAAEGKAVKFVENGRVFIKRGEKIYNVQGQLVK